MSVDCMQYEHMLEEYSAYLETATLKLNADENISADTIEEIQEQQKSYNVSLMLYKNGSGIIRVYTQLLFKDFI